MESSWAELNLWIAFELVTFVTSHIEVQVSSFVRPKLYCSYVRLVTAEDGKILYSHEFVYCMVKEVLDSLVPSNCKINQPNSLICDALNVLLFVILERWWGQFHFVFFSAINECKIPNICGRSAACQDLTVGYRCLCPVGFVYDITTRDCQSKPTVIIIILTSSSSPLSASCLSSPPLFHLKFIGGISHQQGISGLLLGHS